MREYYRLLRDEIERHGGTVEKFIGDAVMAVFGAPVAHEDDPERAVRAGLRILEAIEHLNDVRPSLDLAVRVGINTGEAVVVLGARVVEGEGMVTGDVVNTAARLQSAAPVDAVVVGEPTFAATRAVFEYEALEPVELKGKAEPVALWRAHAARARFGTDLTRHHTIEMVGREVERGILRGLFDRCERSGSPQLVTIVGEPGVGKSRIVLELESYIDEKTDLIVWRQGRCLPYGDGITFWALGEIVKNEAGILDSDSPEQAAAKLDRAIGVSDGEREWFRARLGPLVGLEGGDPVEREEAFTAWRRYLESIVGDRPGVLVFEDLHWADQALLEFIEHVAEWAENSPMLLVCTARPELYERHPNWAGGKRNATTITLDPLTDEETARLVAALLEQTVLPAEVQAAILERSGGNPLYAEEFIRMLKDRGQLVRTAATWELVGDGELSAPDGVHALIAARLDTLSPERKSLLQDAAVIGKTFWAGAVAEMGGRDHHDVRDVLHDLTRKELIRPLRDSSMAGEAEYSFWHVLVGDVAYGQIPRADRAAKHVAAAAWIEAKAGDRVEDLAEVLAHHYGQALELTEATGGDVGDLPDRALRFLMLGADRAGRLDAARAATMWSRVLDLAPAGHPERATVLERWGDTQRQIGKISEGMAALEEAATLFEEAGRAVDRARVLVRLSNVIRATSGAVSAMSVLLEAIGVLEAAPGDPALGDAYAEMASNKYTQGEEREAVEWAERSLALAAELGLPESIQALGTFGAARAFLGDPRGLDDVRRAIELGLARGEGRSTAIAYNNLAMELFIQRGPREAIAAHREAVDLAARRGLAEMEAFTRGNGLEILFEAGAWDEVETESSALRRLPQWDDDTSMRMQVLTSDVRVHVARGRYGAAMRLVDETDRCVRNLDEAQSLVEGFAATSAARFHGGDRAGALRLLEEIADDERLRTSWNFSLYLPRLVGLAVALDLPLARRLVVDLDGSRVLDRASVPALALVAEAEGKTEEAAGLFSEAARELAPGGWGYAEATARLGQGRCLVALSRPEAAEPLGMAREFFARVGAMPNLTEADRLMQETEALSS